MEFEEDSEQEGVFNFGKLGFGYYQVVETEFPKGYITTDQKPIFQVRTPPDSVPATPTLEVAEPST